MEYTELLEQQIMGRLRVDNPWWTDGCIPAYYREMTARLYLDRYYPLVSDTSLRRAVILAGPRRVGKTVMMLHAIQRLIDNGVSPQSIVYVSIETPIYNNIGLEVLLNLACRILSKDPIRDRLYIFFDEIQYLKDWQVSLKSLVDTYFNIKFAASGSAAAALRKQSNESGAGRFTDFNLPPLTFFEYIHLKGMSSLMVKSDTTIFGTNLPLFHAIDIGRLNDLFIDYINYGGYPEVVFSDAIRENPGQFVRHDIIDKVLLRDLPSLYGISDVQELNSLFTMIAYHSGAQFSYEKLSKESGVRKETLRKYITYLEAAYLIRVVRRTDDTAKRYIRETQFKIYLTNPSLRCALFEPVRPQDPETGNLIETAVFAQLFTHQGLEPHYANWHSGKQQGEVDIVIIDPSRLKPGQAIEIKWTDYFFEHPGDLSSLDYYLHQNTIDNAIVTSLTQYGIKSLNGNTLQFIPTACYAYSLTAALQQSAKVNN